MLDLVQGIIAVDDHGHPLPLGLEPEPDLAHPICPYDHPLPLRQRQTNPEYVAAWQALWQYQHDDAAPDHLRELIARKQDVKSKLGDGYNAWVLDQVGVETMIAVAYAPDETLPPPRFRWCSFADWLMWPVTGSEPPAPHLVANYERELARVLSRAGLDTVPATLEDYIAAVVVAELEQRKREGAVAIKFHSAYYRPIDFSTVSPEAAADIYRRAVASGDITAEARRTLQDHLFHRIAAAAGQLELPMQVHTGLGAKPHFDTAGSNPLLLEQSFTAAPRTKFLLLHAGWPFESQAIAALAHENVYLDISCATIHLYARALAQIIRAGLEWFPEKVVFGTDAYSDRSLAVLSGAPARPNYLSGWEEKAWLMNRTAREALALALTEMREDNVIGAAEVEEYADRVMRTNAIALYGLGEH
ncbi:amidohydrolase family protein [Dactylosporangium sp. CA-092794]|uniref:amidohydrolase family protein n=1 Tax=Dactylosporangium sp. CA-092794 TaxID=3239929 RepID=UPI003D8D0EAE